MDVTRILPHLYIGSRPQCGDPRYRSFRHLVLCAAEYQPPRGCFSGVEVAYCPFDDRFDQKLTLNERDMIGDAARRVARRLGAGERVLVTCWQGRNRSGLVVGLAMTMVTGCSGAEAIDWIRQQRRDSLTNPDFVAILRHVRGREAPSPMPSSFLAAESRRIS